MTMTEKTPAVPALAARTMIEAFRLTADAHPDRVAARTPDDSVSYTFAEVRERAASLAAAGVSGVAGGSLLLLPMATAPFGIRADVAMPVVALGLEVHLEHQWASGIEHEHVALARSRRHRLRHAMCRKNHRLTGVWDFVELLHKNGAFRPQCFHNEAVVNDLVPHVDGWPILFEREFDDLDRPVDTGTEATRRG